MSAAATHPSCRRALLARPARRARRLRRLDARTSPAPAASGPIEQRHREGPPSRPTDKLPPRPAGEIRLDGVTPGLAAGEAAEGLPRDRAPRTASRSPNSDEDESFERFCAGGTDIVSSQAPISPTVYAACQAQRGRTGPDRDRLRRRDPRDRQRNQRRRRLPQRLRRRAKSSAPPRRSPAGPRSATARNRGLDSPLKVAGPEPSSGLLSSFSELVLGDSEPSRLLLRGDYAGLPRDESEVLDAVAGEPGRKPNSPPTRRIHRAPRRASRSP